MLPQAKVEEVHRLLALGNISQRQIARELGISRGTVGAIASGKRLDFPANIPEADFQCLLPPMRCRGCGGLVHHPCRLCRIRALISREQARAKARRRDFLAAAG
jgi:hypothetical protein